MSNTDHTKGKLPGAPSSDEFTRTLGQVTWLMTVCAPHRGKPVSWIEAQMVAPLMFKQVRVFLKGKQPIAALSWAYASDAVAQKLATGDHVMALEEWRSGPKVVVAACISPFAPGQTFIERFMAEVEAAKRSGAHKD